MDNKQTNQTSNDTKNGYDTRTAHEVCASSLLDFRTSNDTESGYDTRTDSEIAHTGGSHFMAIIGIMSIVTAIALLYMSLDGR